MVRHEDPSGRIGPLLGHATIGYLIFTFILPLKFVPPYLYLRLAKFYFVHMSPIHTQPIYYHFIPYYALSH